MDRRVLGVALVVGSMLFGACTSEEDSGGPVVLHYDASAPDGQVVLYAASVPPLDATLPDAALDASRAPDTHAPDAADAYLPDTLVPDTNVPDTNLADTNVLDTSVPDTNVADTNVADTNVPDTNLPDTSVVDAGPDTGTCIVGIYGDHYVTAAGNVFHVSGSQQVPIRYASNDGGISGFTQIVQQSDHACGLRSDGTVWCWPFPGYVNGNGDLGNGVIDTNASYPAYEATQVQVNAADAGAPQYLDNVTSISSVSDTYYSFPTCAIRADKTLWCWGLSTQGNIFQGTIGTTASVPYAIAMAASAPPADGGPTPIVTADQVAVGNRHVCVLLAGKVSCFGANIGGNLGTGDTTPHLYPVPVDTTTGLPATVDAIGVGYDLTCALAGGSVYCWGTAGWQQEGNPYIPTNICNLNYCHDKPVQVQVSLPDGGANQAPLTGVTAIRIGYQFGCALDGTANLHCWGAYNGGVAAYNEATPYANVNGALPSTGIVQLTAWGGDIRTAPRYVTSTGTYVVGSQAVTPICP